MSVIVHWSRYSEDWPVEYNLRAKHDPNKLTVGTMFRLILSSPMALVERGTDLWDSDVWYEVH